MKGIFFTVFLGMVESQYSANMVDDIIEASNLASEGAYTCVGSYHHGELVTLIYNLSVLSGKSIPHILNQYGSYIFHELFRVDPQFFGSRKTAFDLLESFHIYVEVELMKLYPNERMPTFHTQRLSDKKMIFTYRSPHSFVAVIEGLLNSCFEYYKTPATIILHDRSPRSGSHADFEITLQ